MTKPLLSMIVALSTWGCSSSGADSTGTSETFIAVSPEEFSGLTCSLSEGGFKLYTATLVDVTGFETDDPNPAFELPSSPPTPCSSAVRFGNVVPATFLEAGHSYVARVAAYDRTDLEPAAPGSPLLQSEGQYVAPRWTGLCGVLETANAASASDSADAGTSTSSTAPETPPADAGPLGAASSAAGTDGDAGAFFRNYVGPIIPVSGRTVTLRGCRFAAAQAD